ncbi:MAG TPA: hypothetical protein VFU09_09930 [Candidatus Udaeobacter sp.]|jgi:hypothetical protein|nr:hypothetical protein [Candidatus Udaeobacter sp.]
MSLFPFAPFSLPASGYWMLSVKAVNMFVLVRAVTYAALFIGFVLATKAK